MEEKDQNCTFCRIAAGELPSKKLYEDETVLAFEDINPLTNVHILVIPRKHIKTLSSVQEDEETMLGHILRIGALTAQDAGLYNGYRIALNQGKDAGQEVEHLHFHVMGGGNMGTMAKRF